ncbi:copper chaperone PCu(A)C [Nocardia sp. X0981]
MRTISRRAALAVAFSTAALLASGCTQAPDETPARQADSVVIREQWVKAVDSGMTAAFAELQNSGDTDIRVVGASSPASNRVELHEIAAGNGGSAIMRPKAGGFAIPAASTYVLAAGGDHMMLMDVTAPLTPGSDTSITLEFEDGSSTTFTAQVRDFRGAQENYEPGGAHTGPAAPATPAHGG